MNYKYKYIKYKLKYTKMKNSINNYQQPNQKEFYAKKRASERFLHIKRLLPSKFKIHTMVDIGSGNAQITSFIAKQLNIEKVYAIDVYPENKFIQPSPDIHVTYIQDKNSILPFENGSVDFVTAFMSLHHIEDLETLIKEINRILTPNGLFFYREHDVTSEKMKIYLDNVHLKFEQDPTQHSTNNTYYWSKNDLEKFITSHGFDKIGDSMYETTNTQAIYHTMYQKS